MQGCRGKMPLKHYSMAKCCESQSGAASPEREHRAAEVPTSSNQFGQSAFSCLFTSRCLLSHQASTCPPRAKSAFLQATK